ncbi:MAG: phosphomannomutase/phosphoglucomutase [bacterium]
MDNNIFKAYDIRGIYPTEINAADVKNIAMAYADWLKPRRIALGRDVRLSGEELWKAAADGLIEMGVEVVDIGVISTDMLYFAVANYNLDGGITISASHNAGNFNGMKFVKERSRPISIDTGLAEIRDRAIFGKFEAHKQTGKIVKKDIINDYVEKMTSFVDRSEIRSLKVVVNPNFGSAGDVIQRVANYYGIELVKINFEPNGNFPKGKPDPTKTENRSETAALVKSSGVDFGVTWDADADRCFFFDEKGNFILPYYATGNFIDYFLRGQPGQTIIIDPRLRWLSAYLVGKKQGKLIINKSGHSFIKERMRKENAIFGAEASAHYYFRDLWYTDNGILPFILMLKTVSSSALPLSAVIKKYQHSYFALEEQNYIVDSVEETIKKVKHAFPSDNTDDIDGYSAEFIDWRMNLRGSNTELLIRLNIEATNKEIAFNRLKILEEVIGGEKA